jgi:hypothetical protein
MSKYIFGIAVIFLGAILVATPWRIFPVCGKGRFAPAMGVAEKPHKCTNTLYAETALGFIAMALGCAALARFSKIFIFTASFGLMGLAVLVILFPLRLTGLCNMATMPCRMGTLPALVTIAVMMAITALSGMVQARNLK